MLMRQFSGELGVSVKYQSRKLESLVLALGTWRHEDQEEFTVIILGYIVS